MCSLLYKPIHKLLYSNTCFQTYIKTFIQAITTRKILKLISNAVLKFSNKTVNHKKLESFNIVIVNKRH